MSSIGVSGPNPHPLLGSTVGIDFSPQKVCTHDCIYCGVGVNTTRKTMRREMFHPVEAILATIDGFLDGRDLPDAFFLTGSGEPSLYEGFGALAGQLQVQYPDVVRTVYTNGALLGDSAVRTELSACDPVSGSLNSADADVFSKLSRHHPSVTLQSVLRGFKALRQDLTRQKLWLDGVFVKGINDDADGLRRLGDALSSISPDLYIVRTTRRTIPGLCAPVDERFRECIGDVWKDVPFPVRFSLPPAGTM